MADTELVSGVDTYVLYKKETTFGTAVAPDAHFGNETNIRFRKTRNTQKIYGVTDGSTGGQQQRRVLKGKYAATISVDFNPINFAHLELIMGTVSGAGTSGNPYIYTHAKRPPSATIGQMIDNGTTDSRRRHAGCIATSYVLRAAEGTAPTCTMEFQSGTSPSASTTLDANATLMTGSEYNFDGASLEAPDGTLIDNIIDSVTLTINREGVLHYGLSETALSYTYGKTVYSIAVTFKYKDDDHWTNFNGAQTGLSALASYATMALKFTNGASKFVDFVFSTVTADPHDDNESLNEALTEDVTYTAHNLTVTERVS